MRLWQAAEEEAVRVFADEPAGRAARRRGRHPARHGPGPGPADRLKVAVVDATGKVVATDTIYPHEPRRQWDASVETLARWPGRTGWN